MVMMQSSNSDTPKSVSPSSNPNSPTGPQLTKASLVDKKLIKFEPIVLERPQPTKFDEILLGNFHDKDDIDMKSRPLTYPKDMSDVDANTKFSLERLKQLSNRTIYNRHSPSDDSNQSPKYPIAIKLSDSSPKGKEITTSSVNPNHKNLVGGGGGGGCHPFPTIYANNSIDMDVERLKLARCMTNGKEFTDFGFRIQLGEFHSDYAHSDTSEELVVDERTDSMPTRDTTTVSQSEFKSAEHRPMALVLSFIRDIFSINN